MHYERKTIMKASGLLAGSAALASLSSLVTTKYLMHLAVDREEPKLIKLAERAFAGNAEEDSFLHARIEAGNRLKAKPCETVRITSHDGGGARRPLDACERCKAHHHSRSRLARHLVSNLRPGC